jgi:hypothetical protein
MLIDVILIEVLKSEFYDSLYGFCAPKLLQRLAAFLRNVWMLERIPLYLQLLPMGETFASLLLILIVLCMVLKLGEDGTYKSSSSLSFILRWFTWFMTAIKSISLRASAEDLTAERLKIV